MRFRGGKHSSVLGLIFLVLTLMVALVTPVSAQPDEQPVVEDTVLEETVVEDAAVDPPGTPSTTTPQGQDPADVPSTTVPASSPTTAGDSTTPSHPDDVDFSENPPQVAAEAEGETEGEIPDDVVTAEPSEDDPKDATLLTLLEPTRWVAPTPMAPV